MKKERFDELLDEQSNMNVYLRLIEIRDELAVRRIKNEDDFWFACEDYERSLFSVMAIAHLAGADGIQMVFHIYNRMGLAIIRSAAEAFREMKSFRIAENLEGYFFLAERALATRGILLPTDFSLGSRNAYLEAGEKWVDEGLEDEVYPIFRERDGEFLGYFGSGSPVLGRIMEWLRERRALFQLVLCD